MPQVEGASLDGLQQIVDRLAAHLERSVAIDDAQGRLVVSSGHFGEEDALRVWAIIHRYSDPRVLAHFRTSRIYTWTEPGRIPENPELALKARICCPIRDHDILFGHLFLIDEGVTDAEIAEAAKAADQVGHLMYQRLALHEESQRLTEMLARQFVSPDPRAQRRAAEQALDGGWLTATDPTTALIVKVIHSAAKPETVQTDLHAAAEVTTRDRFRSTSLAWIRPGEAVVLLFGRAADDGRKAAEQLTARLAASDHHVVAGVGTRSSGDGAAAMSFIDASLACEAASRLPEMGTVVTSQSLGIYRWLLKLPPEELNPDRYPAELQRLIAADPSGSLIDTLSVYLDNSGDAGRTASALHVHRSTLYYRLGRIEAVAGVDLRDGRQRLNLHLGLSLRRIVEPGITYPQV